MSLFKFRLEGTVFWSQVSLSRSSLPYWSTWSEEEKGGETFHMVREERSSPHFKDKEIEVQSMTTASEGPDGREQTGSDPGLLSTDFGLDEERGGCIHVGIGSVIITDSGRRRFESQEDHKSWSSEAATICVSQSSCVIPRRQC